MLRRQNMTITLVSATTIDMSKTRLIPTDATKLDDVDQYFECITSCPPTDTVCATECVEELKENDIAQLNVPSY